MAAAAGVGGGNGAQPEAMMNGGYPAPVVNGGSCSGGAGVGSSLQEVELRATRCSFDGGDLRWVAEAQASRIRLLRGQTGSWRLDLGGREVPLADVRGVSHLGTAFLTLEAAGVGQVGLRCGSDEEARAFHGEIERRRADYERFQRYDQSSVQTYFQYYGKLANQQNMLQDSVRTSLYRRAIVENPTDFKGKLAMDIGAGSGILSFFAAQAGASKVYAVEASSMAEVIRQLADGNGMGTSIEVVGKPVELVRDDEVPQKVDLLVSEPIGTFLFNERMIESYLVARDRFLKPGGKMFPNIGDLYIAPFSDSILHWEQHNKNAFWKTNNFHGLDLTSMAKRCTEEQLRKPIVDYINPECLVSTAQFKRFDFTTISVESLKNIEVPFDFEISQPCLVHGMAGWFDALFEGSNQTINLSTAPWCPGTHWYQIRFLLETPLAVNAGQHIEGVLRMEANEMQSYFVRLRMQIKGTDISAESFQIDLKDPEYRFYTSQNTFCPPGTVGAFGQQNTQQANGGFQQAQFAQCAQQASSPAAQQAQAQQLPTQAAGVWNASQANGAAEQHQ